MRIGGDLRRVALALLVLTGPGVALATGSVLAGLEQNYKTAATREAKMEAGMRLAEILMTSGRGEEARTILAELLKGGADQRLTILMARSYLVFPPTDPDEAMKILKTILKDPRNVEGLLEWASALFQRHDYANAVETYKRVLKLNPKEVRAHYGMVDSYLVQKLWKDADKAARDALAIDPNRAESHYYLGKVHERRRDVPLGAMKAAQEYKAAARLQPQTKYYCALLMLQIMEGVGGYTLTLQELKEKNPAEPAIAFAEGLILDKGERYGESQAKFQGAVAVDFSNTWCHFAYGITLMGRTIKQALGVNIRPPMGIRPSTQPVQDFKAAFNEFSIVRFQDPAFPYLDYIEKVQAERQENEDKGRPDADTEAIFKGWQDYQKQLELRH